MSENEQLEQESGSATRKERGIDPVPLTAGVLTIGVSAYFLLGGGGSMQYVLAVGVITVGLVMLVLSLRRS